MTKSIGHKEEFWRNFKFLLQNAVELGLCKPIDYKKKPQQFPTLQKITLKYNKFQI